MNTVPATVFISGAVEGPVDEALFARLLRHVGATPARVYGKRGKDFLRLRCTGYNRAAVHQPWVILVDLDQDYDCAPLLHRAWLPEPAGGMCFCVAVRAVESWLLADRERVASFLGLRARAIPENPETSPDPKRLVVELARQSRRRDIRLDLVPRPQSGRSVGPAYTSRLIGFISSTESGWRPEVAARSSYSLNKCLDRLSQLVARQGRPAGRSRRPL
ncbi:MAG: hypothetical protein NTZ98_17740 [Acidobacteria bacterium]|jgi:hypothetical protein|nr:hypothetical protein [Acidobacteriota bacterium]